MCSTLGLMFNIFIELKEKRNCWINDKVFFTY